MYAPVSRVTRRFAEADVDVEVKASADSCNRRSTWFQDLFQGWLVKKTGPGLVEWSDR